MRKTITDFYAALERRDGKRACAALTEANRQEAETMDVPAGAPRTTCERAIVEFGGLPRGRVTKIRIEGDIARVTVVGPPVGAGVAELVKENGEWKVDAY